MNLRKRRKAMIVAAILFDQQRRHLWIGTPLPSILYHSSLRR